MRKLPAMIYVQSPKATNDTWKKQVPFERIAHPGLYQLALDFVIEKIFENDNTLNCSRYKHCTKFFKIRDESQSASWFFKADSNRVTI